MGGFSILMALNNKHRFCVEIAAVALFIAVMIFVLELLFCDVPTRIDYLYAGIHQSNDNIELAIVGNSHAGAIGKPSLLGLRRDCVENYSVGGQDLFHVYLIVDELIKCKKALKYIVLFVDYDMLGYSLIETNQRYTDREYYKHADTMQDMSLVNRLMATSNFFRCNREFSMLAKKYKQEEEEKTSMQEKYEENYIPIATTDDAGKACKRRALEMTSIKFRNSLVEENKLILQHIIDLVSSSDMTLILVVPPKRQCFYDYADSANSQISKCELYKMMQSNSNVCFADMYENPNFCDDDFVDADHPNSQGVDKIEQIITERYEKFIDENN